MKLNSLLIAGAFLTANHALAAPAPALPELCQSAINYAAQAISLPLSDGSFADKYDPKQITLKKNFKAYPVQAKYLGSCDEEGSKLKDSWCRVAGGSPEVWQATVKQADANNEAYDWGTMVVTYNRGGCDVREFNLD